MLQYNTQTQTDLTCSVGNMLLPGDTDLDTGTRTADL